MRFNLLWKIHDQVCLTLALHEHRRVQGHRYGGADIYWRTSTQQILQGWRNCGENAGWLVHPHTGQSSGQDRQGLQSSLSLLTWLFRCCSDTAAGSKLSSSTLLHRYSICWLNWVSFSVTNILFLSLLSRHSAELCTSELERS